MFFLGTKKEESDPWFLWHWDTRIQPMASLAQSYRIVTNVSPGTKIQECNQWFPKTRRYRSATNGFPRHKHPGVHPMFYPGTNIQECNQWFPMAQRHRKATKFSHLELTDDAMFSVPGLCCFKDVWGREEYLEYQLIIWKWQFTLSTAVSNDLRGLALRKHVRSRTGVYLPFLKLYLLKCLQLF